MKDVCKLMMENNALLENAQPSCYKYTLEYSFSKCVEENGKCVEKTCTDYTPPNCGNFEYINVGFKCDTDPEDPNLCRERETKCEEYSYFTCMQYNNRNSNDNSPSEREVCLPKEDKSGCELKSCKSMPTEDCGKFIPMNPDEKCVFNSQGNVCEIQTCSGQEGNCNSFIPNDKSKKCAEEGDECQIKENQCKELSADNCYYYDIETLEEDEENPHACIPNEQKNECELKLCEDLNVGECNKFKPLYDDEIQCIARGDKCQLVACINLTNSECSNFVTNNLEYKCVPNGNVCIEQKKECAELPINICMEYGEECYLDGKTGKCMVKTTPDSEDNTKTQEEETSAKSSDTHEDEKEVSPSDSDAANDGSNGKNNEDDSDDASYLRKLYEYAFILLLFLL